MLLGDHVVGIAFQCLTSGENIGCALASTPGCKHRSSAANNIQRPENANLNWRALAYGHQSYVDTVLTILCNPACRYIIPVPVINHFLEDLERNGKYTGEIRLVGDLYVPEALWVGLQRAFSRAQAACWS